MSGKRKVAVKKVIAEKVVAVVKPLALKKPIKILEPTIPLAPKIPAFITAETVFFNKTSYPTGTSKVRLLDALEKLPAGAEIGDVEIEISQSWDAGRNVGRCKIFTKTTAPNPMHAAAEVEYLARLAIYKTNKAAYDAWLDGGPDRLALYEAVMGYHNFKKLNKRTRGEAILMGKCKAKATKLIETLKMEQPLDQLEAV